MASWLISWASSEDVKVYKLFISPLSGVLYMQVWFYDSFITCEFKSAEGSTYFNIPVFYEIFVAFWAGLSFKGMEIIKPLFLDFGCCGCYWALLASRLALWLLLRYIGLTDGLIFWRPIMTLTSFLIWRGLSLHFEMSFLFRSGWVLRTTGAGEDSYKGSWEPMFFGVDGPVWIEMIKDFTEFSFLLSI